MKVKVVNKKKFFKSIVVTIVTLLMLIFMARLFVDFCTYPESYLTTWRYQLHKKVQAGDEEAIEYYQEVYLNNNRTLWED